MDILQFQTIPANSVFLLPEQERGDYLRKILILPKKIRDTLFETDTGAYVRGLAKSYNINIDLAPNVSLAILQIFIGEKNLIQLPAILSTELGLSIQKSQEMASEIEHDIFLPVEAELIEPSSDKKALPPRNITRKPLQNVLNLKELPPIKKQGQLESKPFQRLLPTKSAPSAPKTTPRVENGPATNLKTPFLPATPPKPPSSPVKPLSFI